MLSSAVTTTRITNGSPQTAEPFTREYRLGMLTEVSLLYFAGSLTCIRDALAKLRISERLALE